MDVIILDAFLRPILTVTAVWNTGETGDIDMCKKICLKYTVIFDWMFKIHKIGYFKNLKIELP